MKSKFHIIVAAVCLAILTACGGGSKRSEPVVVPQPAYQVKDAPAGVGTDRSTLAENGDLVTVSYIGYLYDASKTDGKGEVIESSVATNTSAPPFILGVGAVVLKGWDQAIAGMRVGGTRIATLPANLAYGAAARAELKVGDITYPPIPANSPLVYELKLISVVKGPFTQPNVAPPAARTIDDIVVGTGALAETGKTVNVRFTGWVYDGTRAAPYKGLMFDSNVTPVKDLLPFVIDSSPLGVIVGFNAGVKGMREGGKRKIVIPPGEAYGAAATTTSNGIIPPNSTLIFEVELVTVK